MPSDFSPAANNAFKYALQYQKEFGAHISVLHVLEPAGGPQFNRVFSALDDLKKQPLKARKELRAWVDSVADADPSARLIVRTGLPAHEIVQAAKELDIDLIVMATCGLTGWRHFCIGSTAEHVVRAAPCSVLVVREKEHYFTC
ncbi:MAG: universal stress protein [Chthoniobacterales bacterium]